VALVDHCRQLKIPELQMASIGSSRPCEQSLPFKANDNVRPRINSSGVVAQCLLLFSVLPKADL
jgi:hypothetical protein